MSIALAGLVAVLLAAPALPSIVMRHRTVAVDPNVLDLQTSVVGAPGRWTAIHLPEEYTGLMCGYCIVSDEALDQNAMRHDPRKWRLERTNAKTLHLMPTYLPTESDLPQFSTNILLVLNGGYRIDLQISIVDVISQDSELAADSVLTITAPKEVLLSGRMESFIEQRERDYRSRSTYEKVEWFANRMLSLENFDQRRWRFPHRQANTVLRLVRSGSTVGTDPTFWVHFDVENLDKETLYLNSAELVPVSAPALRTPKKKPEPVAVGSDPLKTSIGLESGTVEKTNQTIFVFEQSRLKFGEKTRGVAVTTLNDGAVLPKEWKLVVTPSAMDREPLEVEGLRYGHN